MTRFNCLSDEKYIFCLNTILAKTSIKLFDFLCDMEYPEIKIKLYIHLQTKSQHEKFELLSILGARQVK